MLHSVVVVVVNRLSLQTIYDRAALTLTSVPVLLKFSFMVFKVHLVGVNFHPPALTQSSQVPV